MPFLVKKAGGLTLVLLGGWGLHGVVTGIGWEMLGG